MLVLGGLEEDKTRGLIEPSQCIRISVMDVGEEIGKQNMVNPLFCCAERLPGPEGGSSMM